MAMRNGHPMIPSLIVAGREYVPAEELDRMRSEMQQWRQVATDALRTLHRLKTSITTIEARVRRIESADRYTLEMFPAEPTPTEGF